MLHMKCLYVTYEMFALYVTYEFALYLTYSLALSLIIVNRILLLTFGQRHEDFLFKTQSFGQYCVTYIHIYMYICI